MVIHHGTIRQKSPKKEIQVLGCFGHRAHLQELLLFVLGRVTISPSTFLSTGLSSAPEFVTLRARHRITTFPNSHITQNQRGGGL